MLIGINLLREGLDLPEVSLVAILDADKEGFLRSTGSLIQTIGRAARHLHGAALLYAHTLTDSMQRALDETRRRRQLQAEYNAANGIEPQSVLRPLDMTLVETAEGDYATPALDAEEPSTPEQRAARILVLEQEMRAAAARFEFEEAARLRDEAKRLREKLLA